MVEIFQYIHDYTELHKEMNNLKKYNIFKKKKIVNKMVEIEEKLRNENIYDLLNALYNYICANEYIGNYTMYGNDLEKDEVRFKDNGYIYISCKTGKYYAEYSVNTKTFHIIFTNKSFYVQYDQSINNSNLSYEWNIVRNSLYDLIIGIIALF